MQEAFLHYIWGFRKIPLRDLLLVSGQALSILKPGQHNQLAGPDFLDARIRIDDTVWAGHVEIHVNASDWYAHGHGSDPAYENVVLHVVWRDDTPVTRRDGRNLPTLELQSVIDDELLTTYEALVRRREAFIPCEKEIGTVDPMIIRAWLERLFLGRLQQKVKTIQAELDRTAGNWQAAFFVLLAIGFGTKINKEAFGHMARQIPYKVLCKSRSSTLMLEALFMGMGGILAGPLCADPYLLLLRREFEYLQQKFDLQPRVEARMHFFKLRPSNFPTIRLSQLASLYVRSPDLMSQCIAPLTFGSYHQLLRISTSTYWETHYTFGNTSRSKNKITSYAFTNGLLINVILPFKYAYMRFRGSDSWSELMDVIYQIPSEKNSIMARFNSIGIRGNSMMDSQALLELYNSYCRSKRCLDCAIGHQLLGRK